MVLAVGIVVKLSIVGPTHLVIIVLFGYEWYTFGGPTICSTCESMVGWVPYTMSHLILYLHDYLQSLWTIML